MSMIYITRPGGRAPVAIKYLAGVGVGIKAFTADLAALMGIPSSRVFSSLSRAISLGIIGREITCDGAVYWLKPGFQFQMSTDGESFEVWDSEPVPDAFYVHPVHSLVNARDTKRPATTAPISVFHLGGSHGN